MAIAMRYGTGGAIAQGGSSGGGGLTADALWTNPSPSSSFSAQSVPLSAGASGYKFLLFTYFFATTQMELQSALFPVGELTGGYDGRLVTNGGTVNRTGARPFTLASDTSVTFASASWNGGTSNTYCVPYKIYGIK